MSGISALLAIVVALLWASCCRAGEPLHLPDFLAPVQFPWVDAREPDELPPRLRTNCGFHNGRWYCAERCGTDYQLYYCSRASYGCCHIGDGYCDYRGFLRCRS